jgi:anti-anti-sigma factor
LVIDMAQMRGMGVRPVSEALAETVRVVVVEDELVLSTVPQLEPTLVGAIDSGAAVVLDLSNCEFVDSSGLAMLVKARKRLQPSQRLSLVVPHRIVRRVFEATRLDHVFEIHPTRAEALGPRRIDVVQAPQD